MKGIPVTPKKEREQDGASLRDFKEGRFEDVRKQFDERSARKRGFNPDQFKKHK
jgi:hypothetical protein